MGLVGRVIVVTGAGQGLGREHALLLGMQGAAVVVNDLDPVRAAAVTAEIADCGGRARACSGDISDWNLAEALVAVAVGEFGELHGVVNNAGNTRDRFLAAMSEAEWDDVIGVHLKGHAGLLRAAAAHWRSRHGQGHRVDASVVNTTSISGLGPNPGQANYGAAKAAIAALTLVAADELARYGVRVNAVAPLARTPMTQAVPALASLMAPPTAPGAFDPWDPAQVSPLVAYLLSPACPLTGQVLGLGGSGPGGSGPDGLRSGRSRLVRWTGWTPTETWESDRAWSQETLAGALEVSPES
ncbi:MAG: SDR family NAD(P)-dependent oxidoreductase [Acidimicrobiales bacterium]